MIAYVYFNILLISKQYYNYELSITLKYDFLSNLSLKQIFHCTYLVIAKLCLANVLWFIDNIKIAYLLLIYKHVTFNILSFKSYLMLKYKKFLDSF